MLAEPILDYQTPEIIPPRRVLMRALTLLFLCPLVILKGWGFSNAVCDLVASRGDMDIFSDFGILTVGAVLLTADLFILWRLTAGWSRTKKWIWPRAIYISVPANLIVGGCLYWAFLPSSLRTHPAMNVVALCPLAYVSLVLITLAVADRDRVACRGLKPRRQRGYDALNGART